MDTQDVSAIAAAISAIAAAVAAIIMYVQTNITIRKHEDDLARSEKLMDDENKLLAVQNKIMINQMWNDFNKTVIQGDEALRQYVGASYFDKLDPSMVRRIYVCFSIVNVVEAAWLLKRVDGIAAEAADVMIEDQLGILRRDPDAARLIFSGRGYPTAFVREVWPKVFPAEPLPIAEGGPFEGERVR